VEADARLTWRDIDDIEERVQQLIVIQESTIWHDALYATTHALVGDLFTLVRPRISLFDFVSTVDAAKGMRLVAEDALHVLTWTEPPSRQSASGSSSRLAVRVAVRPPRP
jgi:hypothetical protein